MLRLTIGVTGATGFVGRHVVRALLARGHAVRALVRDAAKAQAVLPADARWVLGHARDRRSLASLCDGCHALVHAIGILREFPPDVTFESAHPGATAAALDAAKAASVGRFVHISALGTRPGAATEYHRSKYLAEQLVRASGLDWTILRPSLIHGPDGEFMKMAKDWVLGRAAPHFFLPWFARVGAPAGFPPVPRPESAKLQPIHVDDVAHAVTRALESDRAIGEVYPLVGPEALDWPTLLGLINRALPLSDGKKKAIPLPGVLAGAAARAAEALGMGAALPFGPSEPIMAMEDGTAALDKARHDLSLTPAAFTHALPRYAASI
jgi:NADH dehydrogenase